MGGGGLFGGGGGGDCPRIVYTSSFCFIGSSHVDFTGFLSVYTKCDKTGDSEEDFDEAFRVFDKEGNGQISAAEMRHILTNLGEKMTEQQTDAFITFAEPDAQGEIDYKSKIT